MPDHIDPGRAVAPGASRLRLDEPLSLLPCPEHERRLPRSQRELLGSPPLAFRPHFYCCFGPVSNADVYTSELEETRTASVYARAGPTAALGGDPRPLEGERPTFQRLKRDTVKPLLKCRARSVCKASHILVLPRPMQRSCASCWRWSSARDIQASPAVKPAPCQARWAGGSVSIGREQGPFPEEMVGIAKEVAVQLAIAITQARLHEQVREQALELEKRMEERTRELEEANREMEALHLYRVA